MRTANNCVQKMYYSLFSANETVYQKDSSGNIVYIDIDGEKTPIPVGNKDVYLKPVKFFGNIAMNSSSGNAEVTEYGLNLSDYSAVLVLPINSIPITETSLIWLDTEPQTTSEGYADEKTADYKVVKVSHSINFDKYILKRIVK